MELIDVIKYFAKFPNRNGVMKNFKRNLTTPVIDGYTELSNYISALPAELMPELTELVISTNEKEVGDRIRNIDNYFMFIEYGSLSADAPDRVRLRNISFNLAVYVCYHNNSKGIDSMEEAIIMDKCLEMVFDISKQMIVDDNLICPHHRFVESGINFSPVEPALMYGAIGWGITFKKSNNTEL